MRSFGVATLLCATAVAALALSGCGGVAAPRPDATPTDRVECGSAFSSGEGAPPTAGSVPEGFDAIAVHRCDPYASMEDADGVWGGVRVERLEGELEPVLAALAEPDEPRWPGPCTADMVLAPDLWLEDSAGRFVHVAYPSTGCGKPRMDAVDTALRTLDVVGERFEKTQLIESRAATAAGCPTQAAVLTLLTPGEDGWGAVTESAPAMTPDPGATAAPQGGASIPWEGPELPTTAEVEGILLCFYGPGDTTEAPGDASPVGAGAWFASSRLLPEASAREVWTAATVTSEPQTGCSDPASRLVIVQPLVAGGARPSSLTVELDGCRRVMDPSLRTAAASDTLLALLTP